jgi:hypothetical protein
MRRIILKELVWCQTWIRWRTAIVTDRVLAPLIIGITGKRDLNGKDEAVRVAFREVFERLDSAFPNTPKILISALAQGADTIAAEEGLRRSIRHRAANTSGCSWTVVALLPFPLELYKEDFDQANADRLVQLCEELPTRVLDPLRQPGQHFEPAPPYIWAELSRRPEGNPDRTAHYEQVGLHIADQCALLIAVMDREEPLGGIGGTARILDYRVRGEIDASGRDIVRRSQILSRNLLDRPQPRPALVIDLASLDVPERSPSGAIWLWEPYLPAAPGEAYQSADIVKVRLTDRRRWFDRLWLAVEIEIFNTRIRKIADTQWETEVEKRAGMDAGDTTSKLRRVRLALSLVQSWNKQRLTRTAALLAALFVFAVVALEIHIEFDIALALYLYIIIFAVILGLYYNARLRRFQQYTENYRAAAEALRVQLAWWDAGLVGCEHRVERTYLSGSVGSLARVRIAVRHLIDSAVLEWGDPKPMSGIDQQWIKGQIEFFRKRIEERRESLRLVERLSWLLFIGSFCAAVVLSAAFLAIGTIDPMVHKWALVIIVGSVAVAGAIRYFTERLSKEHELFSYRDALGIFLRAQENLAALGDDPSVTTQRQRQDIIAALGERALQENEAWIRAHRVRPLEPVVGG